MLSPLYKNQSKNLFLKLEYRKKVIKIIKVYNFTHILDLLSFG